MGYEGKESSRIQVVLLLAVLIAASSPLLFTIILDRPFDMTLIIIETLALAAIGLWGIYIAMRGITRYDKIIKEETQRYNVTKDHAAQLEQNVEIKDLFGDIIMHDLMNPIGIIKNYTELLLEDDKGEKNRTYLQAIKRNTERVIDIIRNTGKLAKIETMVTLEVSERDLCASIKNTVQSFADDIEKRGLNIECACPESCLVLAHSILDDVLYNLLSNAIKYSPDGGKILIAVEDAGDKCKMSFKDNGSGISAEDKDRIFKRFSRLEKGGIKGTGLGLAIVKRAVELHKGRVWVEDNPEGGSIFNVEVPKKQTG